MLGERLDMATAELLQFIHKQTGKELQGAAVDQLRRRLAWHLALAASAVVDQTSRR